LYLNTIMSKYIIVTVTTPTQKLANEIARLVIARQVAACAQVNGPILSVYRWKDKVEESEEWKVEIKTTAELFKEIEISIRIVHSYDVPEIIATPIAMISDDYALWIDKHVKRE